jgi:hypothetical protein
VCLFEVLAQTREVVVDGRALGLLLARLERGCNIRRLIHRFRDYMSRTSDLMHA